MELLQGLPCRPLRAENLVGIRGPFHRLVATVRVPVHHVERPLHLRKEEMLVKIWAKIRWGGL